MRGIITGGSGFLGLHLAHKLAEKGVGDITLVDIADADLGEYPPGTRLVLQDVRDLGGLRRVFAETRPELVVHGAAALPLWKKRDIYSTNVDGTDNVLTAAREAGVPRTVHVSSTAVYGVPKTHPIYEHDRLVGVGHYGVSKIQGEQVVRRHRDAGYPVPVVRPKTFIGTHRLGVFQILYDWVESGRKIPLIGDGSNLYQLLEVEDLCDAIWLCLTADLGQADDTFNVGAWNLRPIREDVRELCDYAGNGGRPAGFPAWLVKPALGFFRLINVSPLYRWVYGTANKDSYVSIEKIRDALGWEPRYSNAQALIRSYAWYLENKPEATAESGVTHRTPWKQGVLGLFKRFM